MPTTLQQLIAAAQVANFHDETITDQLAYAITMRLGHEDLPGFAGSFYRYGWVPAHYVDVLQMHAELTFGENRTELVQALAKYLRGRHQKGLVGITYGWEQAGINQPV